MSIIVKAERENQAKTNGKPTMLAPIYGNIPQEMRERRQWINWKLSKNPKPTGKPWTKIPLDPKHRTQGGIDQGDRLGRTSIRPASDTSSSPHKRARAIAKGSDIILRGDHVGIDLDHCRDPQTGDNGAVGAGHHPERMDSYTEVSPSGTGIRIIGRGKLPSGQPQGCGRDVRREQPKIPDHHRACPRWVRTTSRTGKRRSTQSMPSISGRKQTEETKPTPAYDIAGRIGHRGGAGACHDVQERRRVRDSGTATGRPTSRQVAIRGRSMPRRRLAFWFGPDPELIDAVFRQSGLIRDKWDKRRGSQTLSGRRP